MKATTKTKRVKIHHNYSATPHTLQFMPLQFFIKHLILCLLSRFIWQMLICFSNFWCAYYCFFSLFEWIFCCSL